MRLLLEQYCAVNQRTNSDGFTGFTPGDALYFAIADRNTVLHCLGEAYTLLPSQIAIFPAAFSFSSSVHGISLSGAAAAELAALVQEPTFTSEHACPGVAGLIRQLSAKADISPSEESIVCYTVVCRVAEALPGRSVMPQLVQEALNQIRAHYAEVYGVEELAEQLGVTKSHLIRTFTAVVGQPPGRYLNEVRLHAAKSLLQNRAYTLEMIASLCGFAGANYFCRTFKKATGHTPSAWRALHAAEEADPFFEEAEASMYL